VAEHESKLVLHDAVLNLFDADSSGSLELGHEFTGRSLERRQKNNEQLQNTLTELNTALQSLMQLLAQNYGVAVPTSSTTEAPPITTTIIVVTTAGIIAAPSTSTTDTTPGQTSSPAAPSPFNPTSSSNTVVYYSQTDQTAHISLSQLCADPNIDIIILAFLTHLFSGPSHTGWPSLNLGPNCWAASATQIAAGATGLIDCVSNGFAAQVAQCQAAGKKVMLSVGGAKAYSDTTIPDDEKASEVAGTIWDLFLGGGTRNGRANATAQSIRPFGDAVLDGIGIALFPSLFILFPSSEKYH